MQNACIFKPRFVKDRANVITHPGPRKLARLPVDNHLPLETISDLGDYCAFNVARERGHTRREQSPANQWLDSPWWSHSGWLRGHGRLLKGDHGFDWRCLRFGWCVRYRSCTESIVAVLRCAHEVWEEASSMHIHARETPKTSATIFVRDQDLEHEPGDGEVFFVRRLIGEHGIERLEEHVFESVTVGTDGEESGLIDQPTMSSRLGS